MAEKGLVDSFIDALSVPGNVARTLAESAITGKVTRADLAAAYRNERVESTASGFKGTIAESLGLGKDGLTADFFPDDSLWDVGDSIINTGADIGLDIITSPDSLITGPARLLKAAKFIPNAMKDDVARGATGAVMGALNIDSDDDIFDAVKKIGVGAGIGVGASKGVKQVGKLGKPIAKKLNEATRGMYPEVFERLQKAGNKLTLTEAVGIKNNTDVRRFSRNYYNRVRKVTKGLEEDIFRITGSKEEATEAVTKFRELLGEGFGKVTAVRGSAEKYIKSIGTNDQNEAAGLLFQELRDDLGDDVAQGMIQTLTQATAAKSMGRRGTRAFNANAMNEATDFSNQLFDVTLNGLYDESPEFSQYVTKLVGKRFDPKQRGSVLEAVQGYSKEQATLVKDFNAEMLSRGTPELAFKPLNFHTVDLQQLDNMMPSVKDTLNSVQAGAIKRSDSNVSASLEGLTEDQILRIGAERHAALYMTEAEKQAKQLMGELQKAKLLDPASEGAKRLKVYDDFLQLQKATWLGAGVSWMTNTLPENIAKSYIAAGGKGMLRTLGEGVGASLYSLTYMDKLSRFDGLVNNGYFQKIADLYNPNKVNKSLDLQDPFFNVASDLGVIESSFVQEAQRGAFSRDILESVASTSNNKEIVEMVAKLSDRSKMQKVADKLWQSPFARATTAFENSARLTTFQEVYKNEVKALATSKSMRDEILGTSVEKFTTATQKMLNNKESLRIGREALENAANITRDTFYDYNKVSAVEQYVMKRFIPFWSFMSKDADYWARTAFDNPRVGIAESFTQGMGVPLTAEEKREMPSYTKDMVLRKNDKGEIVRMNALPAQSAIQTLSEVLPFTGSEMQISSKAAPIPRFLMQQITNRGNYGQPVRSVDGSVVRVPDSTWTTMMSDDQLKVLGMERDPDDGRIYTNNSLTSVVSDLAINALSLDIPIARQAIGKPMRDAQFRGRDFTKTQIDALIPAKEVFQTPEQMERNSRRADQKDLREQDGGSILPAKKRRSNKRRPRRARR